MAGRWARAPRLAAGVAVIVGALAAGCASPQEREVERVEDEIEEYTEVHLDRREQLEQSYASAREEVRLLREAEVLEQRRFRDELLARVRQGHENAVLEALERMRRLAAYPDKRREVQARADELEALYQELTAQVDALSQAMVALRAAERDRQLAALDRELLDKRQALKESRDRFVSARLATIQAIEADSWQDGEDDEGGEGQAAAAVVVEVDARTGTEADAELGAEAAAGEGAPPTTLDAVPADPEGRLEPAPPAGASTDPAAEHVVPAPQPLPAQPADAEPAAPAAPGRRVSSAPAR